MRFAGSTAGRRFTSLTERRKLAVSAEVLEAVVARSREVGTVAPVIVDGAPQEHDPRFNPFDLSMYANWIREDPSVVVDQILSGKTDPVRGDADGLPASRARPSRRCCRASSSGSGSTGRCSHARFPSSTPKGSMTCFGPDRRPGVDRRATGPGARTGTSRSTPTCTPRMLAYSASRLAMPTRGGRQKAGGTARQPGEGTARSRAFAPRLDVRACERGAGVIASC